MKEDYNFRIGFTNSAIWFSNHVNKEIVSLTTSWSTIQLLVKNTFYCPIFVLFYSIQQLRRIRIVVHESTSYILELCSILFSPSFYLLNIWRSNIVNVLPTKIERTDRNPMARYCGEIMHLPNCSSISHNIVAF